MHRWIGSVKVVFVYKTPPPPPNVVVEKRRFCFVETELMDGH